MPLASRTGCRGNRAPSALQSGSSSCCIAYAFTASRTVGAGSEQPDVRETAVGGLALRCYGSVRGGWVFDSGRQHVQGHRKGGEPRDQGPKEQADHQDGSAPPRAACPRGCAGGFWLPTLQLCLRPPKLLLQARQFQLLLFGPILHLHALLAPLFEIFGQPLALLP